MSVTAKLLKIIVFLCWCSALQGMQSVQQDMKDDFLLFLNNSDDDVKSIVLDIFCSAEQGRRTCKEMSQTYLFEHFYEALDKKETHLAVHLRSLLDETGLRRDDIAQLDILLNRLVDDHLDTYWFGQLSDCYLDNNNSKATRTNAASLEIRELKRFEALKQLKLLHEKRLNNGDDAYDEPLDSFAMLACRVVSGVNNSDNAEFDFDLYIVLDQADF